MTKRRGYWVKRGEGEVIVDSSVRSDWLKVRKKPGKMKPEMWKEQHKRIAEIGKRVGKECKGLRGEEFKACRSRILEEVLGDKRRNK